MPSSGSVSVAGNETLSVLTRSAIRHNAYRNARAPTAAVTRETGDVEGAEAADIRFGGGIRSPGHALAHHARP